MKCKKGITFHLNLCSGHQEQQRVVQMRKVHHVTFSEICCKIVLSAAENAEEEGDVVA